MRRWLATMVTVLAATAAAAVEAPSGVSLDGLARGRNFPVIRETLTYQSMDWENERTVPRTVQVRNTDPFLPARSLAAARPDVTLPPAAFPQEPIGQNLVKVTNLADFGRFSPDQKALLEANGFVVTPTNGLQMFTIYEQNVYDNLPSYVTADVMLHTYSDLYSYSLKMVERRQLFGLISLLSTALREESVKMSEEARDAAVKEAALENAVFFGSAESMLAGRTPRLPRALSDRVKEEARRIRAAEGEHVPMFGAEIDYSEFTPRGHYTRSNDWKSYFSAMAWYGGVQVDVPRSGDGEGMLNALLIMRALDRAKVRGVPAWEVYARIDELITLFTGPSNYISPLTARGGYSSIVSGKTLDDLGAPGTIAAFTAALNALPPSPIVKILARGVAERQFRFIGKRYVIDTLFMQSLVHFPRRPFASGLDVMAVLGLRRARHIQENVRRVPEELPGYSDTLTRLSTMVRDLPESVKAGSIYWGLLWTVAALEQDVSGAMPFFMSRSAWQDRMMNTGLGSWAEQRHNTILYAESFAAEGEGERYVVELPKGYVEPNPVFFARLRWLADKLRGDLASAGCLTRRMEEKMKIFRDLAEGCAEISIKEWTGQPLTRAQYEFIHFIGSKFAEITTGCLLNDAFQEDFDRMGMWQQLPEGSRNMAVIADVGSSLGTYLEVGVGRPHEIFVAVPSRSGGSRLTRGAVYQYYEFLSQERLTDEKWREMLAGRRAPAVPDWATSYRSPRPKAEIQGRYSSEGWFDYRFVAD